MSRAETSEQTFDAAELAANEHGMTLTNPSEGCYRLKHLRDGWIINMYPRRKGFSPRMYHDPHHRGPFLELPDPWTLLDAVNAAIKSLEGATNVND